MSSIGWIKLEKFKVPILYKIKCRVSKVISRNRIVAHYKYHTNAVFISVKFDGEYIDIVLNHFSDLLKEWGKQNSIQI